MPLRNAEITRHAWLRFLKRWEGEPPECYRTELERLIATAKEVPMGYGAVIRMIKNGFVPARYFEAGYCEGYSQGTTLHFAIISSCVKVLTPRKE